MFNFYNKWIYVAAFTLALSIFNSFCSPQYGQNIFGIDVIRDISLVTDTVFAVFQTVIYSSFINKRVICCYLKVSTLIERQPSTI